MSLNELLGLGKWSDAAIHTVSNQAEEVLPELIPEDKLPPGCLLYEKRKRMMFARDESSAADRTLEKYRQSLSETAEFLRSATIENCTPLSFAEATAKQALLERAINVAKDKAMLADQDYCAKRETFANEFYAYGIAVRAVRERIDIHDRPVDNERYNYALQDIKRFVGNR